MLFTFSAVKYMLRIFFIALQIRSLWFPFTFNIYPYPLSIVFTLSNYVSVLAFYFIWVLINCKICAQVSSDSAELSKCTDRSRKTSTKMQSIFVTCKAVAEGLSDVSSSSHILTKLMVHRELARIEGLCSTTFFVLKWGVFHGSDDLFTGWNALGIKVFVD